MISWWVVITIGLLADSGIDKEDLIDILVGCNYYWSIVTGKLRRGDGEAGPVAVSSKFGWLLSGPMPILSNPQLSHIHVIITAGFDSSPYNDKDTELLAVIAKVLGNRVNWNG